MADAKIKSFIDEEIELVIKSYDDLLKFINSIENSNQKVNIIF